MRLTLLYNLTVKVLGLSKEPSKWDLTSATQDTLLGYFFLKT